MFAAPRTVNSPTPDIATPTNNPLKVDPPMVDPPIVDPPISSSVLIDPIDKTEDKNNPIITQSTDNPSNEKKTDNVTMDKPTPVPPKKEVIQKKKTTDETAKNKEAKGYIGFRVSNEMKQELEDIAQDFAYLARKKYGLKIKDDSSSILRAFLVLGMSCFTEMVRHKTLQEYDPESTLEEEVAQQLLAIMRIHKVEIDEIDF